MILHGATEKQFKTLLEKIKNIISGVQAVGNAQKLDGKSASEFAVNSHKHTKSEITDFPTSMTPTAHKHTKSEITDFPTSMPPTAHDQAASTITAGTLGGQVVANATAVATLGNKQVRNIYAGTDELTAGTSTLATGDIYIQYE